MHPDREFGTAVDQLGHGQKLDGIAQAVGVGHVDRSDPADPLPVDVDIDHVAPERQRGQDRRLRRGVVSLDIGRGVALGQTETLASAKASSKSTPSSSIRVKMKFVVPLTMPMTRTICSPASDSRRARMIGMAPATAAS